MCFFIYQFMDIRIVFILRLLLIQLLCDLALKSMLLTFTVMSPQWSFCEHSGTHLHVDRYFYFSLGNICECFCWAAWVYAYFVRKCPPFSTLALLFCVPVSHKSSSCSIHLLRPFFVCYLNFSHNSRYVELSRYDFYLLFPNN